MNAANDIFDLRQFDRASGILLLLDPASLQIIEVSESTVDLLGYEREALLGRPITDIEADLADALFWEDWRASNSSHPRRVQGGYRCGNGDILAVQKTVSHVADQGRAWLMVRAEPEAATSAIEEQMAATTAMLNATLEATADGILVVDRSGTIVNMNRRFAQMWNLSEALLQARADHAIFAVMAASFADPAAYGARLATINADIAADAFDVLHLADGRCFERSARPARHGRTIYGRVFSFNDITARVHAEAARLSLEAQLRESQKMEAIGTLAGGIAHDFNNILATILGNAELARQDHELSPLTRESIEEIRKAGARARDLVQQILSFSRRQPTARKPLDLVAIVGEAERLLRATLPARVALSVDIGRAALPVLADSTQVQQVIFNLATNAMQAMHGRPGAIRIGVDAVMLDARLASIHPSLEVMYARKPGEIACLVMRDDGSGMDAATLARIFEPFFTTKPVNEGTGLGLSVVLGIVQAHDGAILVDSEPGQGTTFRLYLPLAEHPAELAASLPAAPASAPASALAAPEAANAEVAPDAQAAATDLPGPGPRILYVDDDESLVFLVTRLLERRGFAVSAHSNQEEALAELRRDPAAIDLLVTDYNMPGLSGLDVARAAMAMRADLPVVVASGFIDERLQLEATAAGVRELVFKANAVETLCDAIARMVRDELAGRSGG